jgi:hypothetical protein
MTQAITSRHLSRLLSRLAAWTTRPLERLSDRIHAGGEAIARQHGWEVTRATGRLGLGARTYHDPRFTQRALGTGHSDPGRTRLQPDPQPGHAANAAAPPPHHHAGEREEGTHARGHPSPSR